MRLYKVTIDAVDGVRFYSAGGPDRAELFAFLTRHDHEGSTVTLEWSSTPTDGLCLVADPERVYRILAGREEVG